MTDSPDINWISNYYNKIQSEFQISFGRRDNVTNWSYSLVAALFAIYFGFFSESLAVPQFWRYSFVVGMMVILVRFFFQSMIAYGFLQKWIYLKKRIQELWLDKKDVQAEIRNDIQDYDHGKYIPKSRNYLFLGQIRSGFIIIVAIPIILITNEFSILGNNITWEYKAVIIGFIIYVGLELINFFTYVKVKEPST